MAIILDEKTLDMFEALMVSPNDPEFIVTLAGINAEEFREFVLMNGLQDDNAAMVLLAAAEKQSQSLPIQVSMLASSDLPWTDVGYVLFDKLLGEFDPTKIVSELSNMLKHYRITGVDIDAIVASQKKNLEALTSANRVAIEGLQAVVRREADILQETMNEASKAVDALAKAGSPAEVAAKRAELTRGAFERALGNMRELAEMVAKANQEATSIMNTRISVSLEELKEAALKLQLSA